MPTYARGWRWETVMLAVMPASPACVLSSARVPYGVSRTHTGYVSIATNVYAIPRARGELSEAGPCRHMHGAALCRVQDTIIRKKTAFT